MPMKVLVVGGAGYIGGGVTDILSSRGIPFSVYDDLLYERQYLKNVEFILGDVRNTKKLSKLLPKYSHIIWLAAIVGDAACQIRPSLTTAVNRDAVRWLSEHYSGRIIFASTCSVYGEVADHVTETSSTKPLSLYARTKLEAEQFLKRKNALIFRLGTVFGISDMHSRLRMDLAVNYMTASAYTRGALSIYGGKQWRPLIHVRNVAEAMVNALSVDKTGIYNLATYNYRIKQLGQEIGKITGCKVNLVKEKFQDNRSYRVSTEKAKRNGFLRFDPTLSISYGVKQVADAVSSGRIKYIDSDVFSNERHILNLHNEGRLK